MSATTYAGPSFERVEEIQREDLVRRGGFGPRTSPILVKGAVPPQTSSLSMEQLRVPSHDGLAAHRSLLVLHGTQRQSFRVALMAYLHHALGRDQPGLYHLRQGFDEIKEHLAATPYG